MFGIRIVYTHDRSRFEAVLDRIKKRNSEEAEQQKKKEKKGKK